MKNLAGQTMADLDILDELSSAGIEVVEGEKSKGEVPYTLTGKLGSWALRRAWYYWIARSKDSDGLPLEIAQDLNERFGGVVRVDGFPGGIQPNGAVENYHIVTQEGLNALADTIRAYEKLPADTGAPQAKIDEIRERIAELYKTWQVCETEEDIEWIKKDSQRCW